MNALSSTSKNSIINFPVLLLLLLASVPIIVIGLLMAQFFLNVLQKLNKTDFKHFLLAKTLNTDDNIIKTTIQNFNSSLSLDG